MGNIGSVTNNNTTAYQPRSANAATTNAMAAATNGAATGGSGATAMPRSIIGTLWASAFPLSPAMANQLLAQQSANSAVSGPGLDPDASSGLTPVSTADLPHISVLDNLTGDDKNLAARDSAAGDPLDPQIVNGSL